MLFGQVNFQNAYHQVKRHIGHAYHTTRKWGGIIDGYANIAGRLLTAVSPHMQRYGASQAVEQGIKGLQSYDALKQKALGADQEVQSLYGNVRRSVPELGL